MTTPLEPQPQEAALFRTIRGWGITRGDNGVVGGVVEGLGERIGMARVPARIIVVVAALLLQGIVPLAYAAGWALLPDRRGNIIIQNFGRGVPNVGALIGIGVLTLIGLGGFDNGPRWIFGNQPWGGDAGSSVAGVVAVVFAILIPLAVVAGIVTLVVVLAKRGSTPPPGRPVAYAVPPAGGAPDAAPADAPPADAPSADAPDGTSAPATEGAPAASPPPPVYAAMPPHAYAVRPVAPPFGSGPPLGYGPPSYGRPHPYPPAPFAPPRGPRVPGPGRVFYLTALAWVILAAAGVAWFDRLDRLAVHPSVAWFVMTVTGLGVIAILVSLAGRKLGFLGFCAVALMLPTLILGANADDLRTAYDNGGGIDLGIDVSVDDASSITVFDPAPAPAFDPTLAFGSVYRELVFNGSCYETNTDAAQGYDSTSVARVNLSGLTEDTTVDITAATTYVTVTSGTSLIIEGEMNAPATVAFKSQALQCDFWDSEGTYLTLANPDAPTLTLAVYDDQYANTIVIEEIAP